MILSHIVKVVLLANASTAFTLPTKNSIVPNKAVASGSRNLNYLSPPQCSNTYLKFEKNLSDVYITDNVTNRQIDNGKADFIAPTIYATFTVALIYIIYQLRDAIALSTLGSSALSLVTGALIWDNAIISIGSIFFKDVETNPVKYNILKTLSYPRFTLHAVGVPLQWVTIAEMGKSVGIEILQNDITQIGIAMAAVIVVSDSSNN